MLTGNKIGEIFVCGPDTNGILEPMEYFLGRPISGLGGGGMKIFVMEEGDGKEGLVSSLHPPQYDLTASNMVQTGSLRTLPQLPGDQGAGGPGEENLNEIAAERILEGEEEAEGEGGEEDKQEDVEEDDKNDDVEPAKMEKVDDFEKKEEEEGVEEKEVDEIEDEGVIEDEKDKENIHEIESTFRASQTLGSVESAHENLGFLKQIAAGKQHILHLTEDGFVYSYGSGLFSVSGHGGAYSNLQPQIIKALSNKKIIQIACGQFHSLALTDQHEVYSWGRGFEGQLGISKTVNISSKPLYIKAFYQKPVQYIAAGAYYSLAVTADGKLYGWGEAKLGQLGMGKQRIEIRPSEIRVEDMEEDDLKKTFSTISIKDRHPSTPALRERRVKLCSAGLAHTAAVLDTGELYMWGFNFYGQLGLGDNLTRWSPARVYKDILGALLPPIKHVACGYYSTYIIDIYGRLFSWGKGYIGHKSLTLEEYPRKIEFNTENRVFEAMVCNEQATVLYAPMRIYSISPKCGPASGGTILSIIGTALKDTPNIKAKFTYGENGFLTQEVECTYDAKVQGLCCKTPKFDDFEKSEGESDLNFPYVASVSITLDGLHFTECEENFLIYSPDIKINTINPKCGSVAGGATLRMVIDIDEKTSEWLYHLTVGFQARVSTSKAPLKKMLLAEKYEDFKESRRNSRLSRRESSKRELVRKESSYRKMETGFSQHGKVSTSEQFNKTSPINPLDPSPEEANLETENWYCAVGNYEDGKITCKVPQLVPGAYDPDSMQYNIDVAINGQQFTGAPVIFRYYDLHITEAEPKLGNSEGGAVVKIKGSGLYDSAGKKFKLQTDLGERQVAASWERKTKCFSCIIPPLTWLFGGRTPTQEEIQHVKDNNVKILITLNGQEWIFASTFRYYDPIFTRMSYVIGFGEGLEQPERMQKWAEEESEPPIPTNPDDLAKYEAEMKKKIEEEEEEFNTIHKRTGTFCYLWGDNFIKTDTIKVRFSFEGKNFITDGVYKNEKRLGCIIPDMVEIPVGEHQVFVDISFNGLQFTNSGKILLYNSHDRSMSKSELLKLEEQEAKTKKGGAKPGAVKKGKK